MGVAPSVIRAIALLFTAAPVLLTFSAYLQSLITGFQFKVTSAGNCTGSRLTDRLESDPRRQVERVGRKGLLSGELTRGETHAPLRGPPGRG